MLACGDLIYLPPVEVSSVGGVAPFHVYSPNAATRSRRHASDPEFRAVCENVCWGRITDEHFAMLQQREGLFSTNDILHRNATLMSLRLETKAQYARTESVPRRMCIGTSLS